MTQKSSILSFSVLCLLSMLSACPRSDNKVGVVLHDGGATDGPSGDGPSIAIDSMGGGPTCTGLEQAAQTQFQSYLDSTSALACQADSDCTLLLAPSPDCIIPCGQIVAKTSASGAAAAASTACNQFFGARCVAPSVPCYARRPVVCDHGQCAYSTSFTDAGAGGSSGGSTGTGGGGSGGVGSDASTCSCTGDTLTWDCYCSAYSCSATLDDYRQGLDKAISAGMAGYEEYANCNLAVVQTKEVYGPWVRHVFDLDSGRLVGNEFGGDQPFSCPFGPDGSSLFKLGAGLLEVGPGCVRSYCVGLTPLSSSCGSEGQAAIDGGVDGASSSDGAVSSVCAACAADELCVGYYDGTCQPLSTSCRKVSAETRQSILVNHTPCFANPASDEICGTVSGQHYWGCGEPSCPNETLVSDVNCYGP